jgi:hypothetical protein
LGGTTYEHGNGISVDASGNVYIVGFVNSPGGAGSTDVLIAKYNTSGVLQWQRSLGGGSADVGNGISVDSSGNVYITGRTNSQGAGSYDVLVTKLPANGGLTGIYGSLTYSARTLTDSARTLTDSARTLTDSARTLTDSAGTLSSSGMSLASSSTTIQIGA